MAKILEAEDRKVYGWTGHIISGHTLKHLAAAMVPIFLTLMLAKRDAEPNRYHHPHHHTFKVFKMTVMSIVILFSICSE